MILITVVLFLIIGVWVASSRSRPSQPLLMAALRDAKIGTNTNTSTNTFPNTSTNTFTNTSTIIPEQSSAIINLPTSEVFDLKAVSPVNSPDLKVNSQAINSIFETCRQLGFVKKE